MAEVGDRIRRGLVNRDDSKQRRDRDVIRENALTYFNMVLFSLILILFILAIVDQDSDHAQDAFFVGIVVAANITIGTWQELRATHALRALQALAQQQGQGQGMVMGPQPAVPVSRHAHALHRATNRRRQEAQQQQGSELHRLRNPEPELLRPAVLCCGLNRAMRARCAGGGGPVS